MSLGLFLVGFGGALGDFRNVFLVGCRWVKWWLTGYFGCFGGAWC